MALQLSKLSILKERFQQHGVLINDPAGRQ